MTVYLLRSGANATSLACGVERDYSRVHDLAAAPIDPADWAALRVEIIRDGSGGSDPSDLLLLGVEPAFTARAVEALQHILYSAGQVLPLRSRDGEFYLWHITRVVDALDEPALTATRFTSGKIMMVDRWAFRPDAVRNEVAFKVPQFPRAYAFVTDPFVAAVQEAGLIGFDPETLWAPDGELRTQSNVR